MGFEEWKYIRCNDRGQRDGVCQICGASLRFEHILKNPSGWEMTIGCECADRILNGEDLDSVASQDKQMKSKARAKARKDARNEILYQAYIARCDKWDAKNPDFPCVRKTKEEIYG